MLDGSSQGFTSGDSAGNGRKTSKKEVALCQLDVIIDLGSGIFGERANYEYEAGDYCDCGVDFGGVGRGESCQLACRHTSDGGRANRFLGRDEFR
jgi:hypothetical protein